MPQPYDLVIHGGQLVDPANNRNGRYDLAVSNGRVAAVEPHLDPALGRDTLDASGLIVTPGLVDLHTHIYWGVTYWGIEADPVAARSGVTTWVDAGSAGSYTLPGFREYVAAPSQSRILCFLNLSSIGLVAPTWEFANLDYCNVEIAEQMVAAYRDLVVGIKARIDANTTRSTGLLPLERARELADRVGLPLMVHIGSGPPQLAEIVSLLRPGDMLTHCFTGGTHRIVDQHGHVDAAVRDLQRQGLILDIGHGAGSFDYAVAEAALADGVVPDVISSDIHQLSVQGPMYDMPTTLTKFLNLGMPLPDVIARATVRPAQAIGRPDLGTLAVGKPADIALFRLDDVETMLYDVTMAGRPARQQLICTQTLVAGQQLAARSERPPAPWAILPLHQQATRANRP